MCLRGQDASSTSNPSEHPLQSRQQQATKSIRTGELCVYVDRTQAAPAIHQSTLSNHNNNKQQRASPARVATLTSHHEMHIRKRVLCLHERTGMSVVEHVKDAVRVHPHWRVWSCVDGHTRSSITLDSQIGLNNVKRTGARHNVMLPKECSDAPETMKLRSVHQTS